MSGSGANRLVMAIYAGVCNDLIQAYYKSDHGKDEAERHDARAAAERWERWLRDNPYQFLTDPEIAISGIRQRYAAGYRRIYCPEYGDRKAEKIRVTVMSF